MVLLLFKRIGFMIFTMIVVSIILFLLLETGLRFSAGLCRCDLFKVYDAAAQSADPAT
jgi:hypothetical protein